MFWYAIVVVNNKVIDFGSREPGSISSMNVENQLPLVNWNAKMRNAVEFNHTYIYEFIKLVRKPFNTGGE